MPHLGEFTKKTHANLSAQADLHTPKLHASRHENGGLDEISVAGLSGLLGDAQTPLAHKDKHKKGGSDAFTSSDELILALENLASDPSSVKAGRIFYHTGHKGPHIDDGSAIKDLASAYNALKLADMYNSIVQGTWAWLADVNDLFAFRFYNSSNAQNDELQYKFFHKAGSFTLVILTATGTNVAIYTISIDGVSQGTIDCYSGSLVNNVVKTLAITIVTDGEHTLNIKAATRNAASNGWYIGFQTWHIRD